MSKLLHVTLYYSEFDKERDPSPLFNNAKDWLRYAPNSWIIVVDDTDTVTLWRGRLRDMYQEKEPLRLLVIEMSAGFAGWLSQEHWDWVRKHDIQIDQNP